MINKKRSSKDGRSLNSKSVLQMTKGGKKLKRYTSITEAGKVTGVDKGNISKASRGILQTAGGFVWRTN